MNDEKPLVLIEKQSHQLRNALDEICMARTPLEIEFFVAGRHVHPMQQYKQLIIDLQVKYDAIKGALNHIAQKEVEIQLKGLEIKKLAKQNFDLEENELKEQKINLEIDEIKNGIEQTRRAMKGALRECCVMFDLIMNKYKDYLGKNEETLLKDEIDYWIQRLGRQAQIDLQTTGRVQWGNSEAILMLPETIQQKILAEAKLGQERAKQIEVAGTKLFIESHQKQLRGGQHD